MTNAAFTHTVVVDAGVDELWDRLQSVDTWQSIGPVQRVWDPIRGNEGELLGYRWSTSVGGRPYEGTAKTIASHPDESMLLSLDGGEVSALLNATLDPVEDGEGTSLEVTMEIEPKGVLGNLFFAIIASAVRSGLEQHLDEFAARYRND